jgi:hypothetical protein
MDANKLWRIFWFVRLGVAAGLTYWAWHSYRTEGIKGMVLVSLVISVWTMWTSDLPDGKEKT